ncbi:hypothetical protein Bcep1808_3945 [Burkholderia vietnamiensis G4]|uniref:Uncharacterized protein n=1 Tax=Burkholderia vietnamiensis (strain G4 / LMG 22486) TaxID=269482 RepID=A4JKX3_BURVG|nr:hypothetical protein Bcep1808_3945 [Burkholderia vietnamiensis G4]
MFSASRVARVIRGRPAIRCATVHENIGSFSRVADAASLAMRFRHRVNNSTRQPETDLNRYFMGGRGFKSARHSNRF